MVVWVMGIQMDLDFKLLETGVLAISILITSFALQDGSSHYLKGFILLLAYVVIGACFFVLGTPSGSRPVAACNIYKCLLQWRLFEVERTNVFDRIIQTIGHAIEAQEDNDALAYWLSNASTLLVLLQRTLKANGAAGMALEHRRSSSATLFGRMTQSFKGIPQGVNLSFSNDGLVGGVDTLRQVETKYPALLFKQQLTTYIEKIYGRILDNLKRVISPLLGTENIKSKSN